MNEWMRPSFIRHVCSVFDLVHGAERDAARFLQSRNSQELTF